MPYPYKVDLPELVRRAYEHAAEIGFPMMLEGRPIGYEGPPTTIIPEDGALLRTFGGELCRRTNRRNRHWTRCQHSLVGFRHVRRLGASDLRYR